MADAEIHYLDARGPDSIVVYAIGDVHGRLDLLTAMHEAIAQDRQKRGARDWRIIHLGDHVDRGPQSKGVLDFLNAATLRDPRIICLAGNHDYGFLNFLAEPQRDGLFVGFGGVATAKSYGIALNVFSQSGFEKTSRALIAKVSRAHIAFLAGLTTSLTLGDFFFCHAGIRPGVPLADQKPEDLVWIREPFLSHAGLHPKVVVHGHTPVSEPEALGNRVNVDTGAFMSGRLTAFVVNGAEKAFLEVSG